MTLKMLTKGLEQLTLSEEELNEMGWTRRSLVEAVLESDVDSRNRQRNRSKLPTPCRFSPHKLHKQADLLVLPTALPEDAAYAA